MVAVAGVLGLDGVGRVGGQALKNGGTNGTSYGPTTEPPTNPGVYNVKVSYTMQSGYAW